jgi:hypothetical protein
VAFLFAVYYYIALIFNGSYANSGLRYPIFLSIFVFIVGYLSGKFLFEKDIELICTMYAVSGIVVCIDVFFKYVYGRDLTSIIYAYSSKNSVSQILLTTWIIVLLIKFPKMSGFIRKAFYITSFALLTVTLLGLRSRATIIGIPIVLFWVILNGKLNRKLKNIILLLIVATVIFFLLKPNIYDWIVNNIIYGGRDASNLESLSSGRASQWMSFGEEFKDSWMFGHGADAKESLILTALLEYGILGGSLIFSLAVYPFAWGLKCLIRQHPYYLLFMSIALVYCSNGIFEQLAPFGPGVKCYFLWFLFGILKNDNMTDGNLVSEVYDNGLS